MAPPNFTPWIVISSIEQISAEGLRMCDDLLRNLIERTHGVGETTVEEMRGQLWHQVFEDHWTTAKQTTKPSPLTEPHEDEDKGVRIGVFKEKSAVDRRFASLKHHGQPVFLNLKFRNNGDLFFVCEDRKGTFVPRSSIENTGSTSLVRQKALAIIHKDVQEFIRVRRWNLSLAVYWTRKRLIALTDQRATLSGTPTYKPEEEEDMDEFRDAGQSITCVQKLEDMRERKRLAVLSRLQGPADTDCDTPVGRYDSEDEFLGDLTGFMEDDYEAELDRDIGIVEEYKEVTEILAEVVKIGSRTHHFYHF
ncbi:hypothetical protein CCHL11_01048 [Colletotrichum chlorophyti]|uniref:Uncharacterized protein n=1 Tax=Colletotrichum chlorophyti TaxID=708187 RepID=A0A1Q8S841_9PEZI|nr:hypothetical protein CCHL11_01048 [Colletotrichum chlorophyti]